jgi:hypothetical protein
VDNPRWEDFDYTYLEELGGNPQCWLGNGFALADTDGTSRVAHLYADQVDYPPIPADEAEAETKATTNGHQAVEEDNEEDFKQAHEVDKLQMIV